MRDYRNGTRKNAVLSCQKAIFPTRCNQTNSRASNQVRDGSYEMHRAGSEGFTGVSAQRKEAGCCLELAWKLALTAGVLKCIVRARRRGWTGSLRDSFSTLRDATAVCASTIASFRFPRPSFRFSPKSRQHQISAPTSGSALLKLISLAEHSRPRPTLSPACIDLPRLDS